MKVDRQAQFRAREILIFDTAEQLLLENGESGMTLDILATELDLAKGTLYKHFQSKDELFLMLIIRNEDRLFQTMQAQHMAFQDALILFMSQHLYHPNRTVIFQHIEERLAMTGQGLQTLFRQLYQIRKTHLKHVIALTDHYLESIQSKMSARDYLAGIWSLTQGAAIILNSSFYQRYLGSRETLCKSYIGQALAMPLAITTPQFSF